MCVEGVERIVNAVSRPVMKILERNLERRKYKFLLYHLKELSVAYSQMFSENSTAYSMPMIAEGNNA